MVIDTKFHDDLNFLLSMNRQLNDESSEFIILVGIDQYYKLMSLSYGIDMNCANKLTYCGIKVEVINQKSTLAVMSVESYNYLKQTKG